MSGEGIQRPLLHVGLKAQFQSSNSICCYYMDFEASYFCLLSQERL